MAELVEGRAGGRNPKRRNWMGSVRISCSACRRVASGYDLVFSSEPAPVTACLKICPVRAPGLQTLGFSDQACRPRALTRRFSRVFKHAPSGRGADEVSGGTPETTRQRRVLPVGGGKLSAGAFARITMNLPGRDPRRTNSLNNPSHEFDDLAPHALTDSSP